ncbi:MAG: hypothetical protein JHD16_12970, partial [Solirubrobacteraceae bacterium]|nr:hypothetical protein [Solirubrobacteraceae bacterium]
AQADRLATCAGFLALLRAASSDRPLLLLLDDVQWLDAPSAECLGYAARRLSGHAVGVLAAARAETPVPSLSGRPVRTLTVPELGATAARSLLDRREQELAASAIDSILAAAHGNPLALIELPGLLDDDQRRGLVPFAPAINPGGSLWDAFARRLGAISVDAAAAMLVVAASVDRSAAPIISACGSLGLGMAAIEEAEQAGLLRVTGAHMTLAHPLMRGVVMGRTTGADHRRVHAALADHAGPDARAWHLAAAVVGASEEAANALDAAAGRAVERGAHVVAGEAFERAANLTADRNQERGRRLIAAAQFGFGGAYARASATLDPVTQADDLHMAGAAKHLQAIIGLVGGVGRVLDHHHTLTSEARRVRGAAPAAAAALYADAAMVAVVGGDCRTALATARDGAELLPPDAPAITRGQVYAMLGLTHALTGDTRSARHALGQVGTVLNEIDPVSPMAGTISFGLHARNCIGETAALHADIVRLARAVQESGAQGLVPHYMIVAADASYRLGLWDQAESEAEEAISVAELCGQRGPLAAALAIRARLHAGRGRSDAAREDVHDVLTMTADSGYVSAGLTARTALGFLELTAGRIDAAIIELEAIAAESERTGIVDPVANLWVPDLVEAYCSVGRLRDAATLHARTRELAERDDVPLARAITARCSGLIDDDFDPAFDEALAYHAAAEAPFETARTLLCFGARLHRAGRRIDARTRLRQALEGFQALQATPWVERTEAELRSAGAVRRDAVQDPTRLSAQEERIALAAARGLTNREIAAEFFISPKTVEFHLGRAFRKLGVKSRVQLAALAADGTLETPPSSN